MPVKFLTFSLSFFNVLFIIPYLVENFKVSIKFLQFIRSKKYSGYFSLVLRIRTRYCANYTNQLIPKFSPKDNSQIIS